jgi:hypothetical protein
MSWTGLDGAAWTVLDWNWKGLSWNVLDWNWTGLNWAGLELTGLDRTGRVKDRNGADC